MKILIKSSLALLFLALSISSCKPEIKEIGDFNEIIDGFPGTWTLQQVTVSDLLLPVPETEDITTLYTKSSTVWTIQFEADGAYSVLEKGPGPNVFGDGGLWSIGPREDFPSELILDATDRDPVTFRLGNMPRETDVSLQLRYTRSSCGQDYIRYNFTFNRQ